MNIKTPISREEQNKISNECQNMSNIYSQIVKCLLTGEIDEETQKLAIIETQDLTKIIPMNTMKNNTYRNNFSNSVLSSSGVYMFFCKKNKVSLYIGAGGIKKRPLSERIKQHLQASSSDTGTSFFDNMNIIKQIKTGNKITKRDFKLKLRNLKLITISIIEQTNITDKEISSNLEKILIHLYRPIYNIS